MADDDLETSLRWSSDPDAADDDDIAEGSAPGRSRARSAAPPAGERPSAAGDGQAVDALEPRLAKLVADLDDLVQQARRAALDRRDLTSEMRDGLGELRDALRVLDDAGVAGMAAELGELRGELAALRRRVSLRSKATALGDEQIATLADAVADRLVERLGLDDG